MDLMPTAVRARSAWADALGEQYVVTDASACAAAARTTFPVSHSIPAILRPGCVAEVQACVRIANAHGIPVYPISAGKNWGLGSRVPSADGCALLDLSRLDRIVDFDEKLAYITVEAGVTFRRAHDFLRERKAGLFLSMIGGPEDASLIGNAMERGDGQGQYSDRAEHACAAQVVLPDGILLDTGFARFPGARVAPLARWGVGPSLDGLFTQSNFGIVTRMTFWLAPIPTCFASFFATLADKRKLVEFVEALQPLMLRDLVRPGRIGMWNAYKSLASEGGYPWTAMQGRTPLDLNRSPAGNAEPWFASGTLLAWSDDHLESLCAMTKAALSAAASRFSLMRGAAGATDPAAAFPLGTHDPRALRSVYWRRKTDVPPDPDPDRDRCGVTWVCPQIPFDGERLTDAIQRFEAIYHRFRFEPNIGIAPASCRAFHVYLAIMWDRDVAGEDEAAMACQDELHRAALELGLPPYRLGIQTMPSIPGGQPEYVDVLRKLKQALDPNDVLAPGRYDWRHEWR